MKYLCRITDATESPTDSDSIQMGRVLAKNTTHLCICLRDQLVRRKQVSPEVGQQRQ